MRKLCFIDLDPELFVARGENESQIISIDNFEPKTSYKIPWAYYREDPEKKYWPNTIEPPPHEDGLKEVSRTDPGYLVGLIEDLRQQKRYITLIPPVSDMNENWKKITTKKIGLILAKLEGKRPSPDRIEEVFYRLFPSSLAEDDIVETKKDAERGKVTAPIRKKE